MASNFIVDINEENIQAELLDKSMDVPVLIDVWADWCEPCKALSPVLHRLVDEYQGRFVLAKINADEQQNIVAQLQVKSLPTLQLLAQGKIVGELIGVQPESAIRALLDPHLGEPEALAVDNIEAVLEEIEALCGSGQLEQAMILLKAIIEKQPESEILKVRYARLLLNLDALDDAQTIFNSLSDEVRDGELGKQFYAQLFFAEFIQGSPGANVISERIKTDDNDLEAKCYLAAHQVMTFQTDSALDLAWQIFRDHRSFTLNATEVEKEEDQQETESTGKKFMLALFDLLGKQDSRVTRFRRKMFALLH